MVGCQLDERNTRVCGGTRLHAHVLARARVVQNGSASEAPFGPTLAVSGGGSVRVCGGRRAHSPFAPSSVSSGCGVVVPSRRTAGACTRRAMPQRGREGLRARFRDLMLVFRDARACMRRLKLYGRSFPNRDVCAATGSHREYIVGCVSCH